MTASARLETWHGVAAAVLTSGDTEVVVVPELGMLVAAFVVDGFGAFPFPHTLRIVVRVGRRRLRVDTVVDASGGVSVPVSFGWHPYWRVPGARDDWTVGLPDVAHARLDRRALPTGRARVEPAAARPLRGQAFDDLFAFAGDRTAELRGGGRRLRLALDAGYPFVQAYAPDAQGFCCLEPMTAPTNALVTGDHPTVRPGASFTASFTATVSTA